MIRTRCVICNCDKFSDVITFKDFPVFMGTVPNGSTNFHYNDLKLVECTQCKTVQVLDLIDIKLLYQANHNIDVVGDLWKRHNSAFAEFIIKSNPKNVLEVGDPAFKISSLIIDKVDSWCIVEPNISSLSVPSDKIKFTREWFENIDTSEFHDISCVVLSHVFEHLYDPRSFLKKCVDITDTIIISVPNMDNMLESNSLPSINFEHTFFLNEYNLQIMLHDCGYYIDNCDFFENHSIFYRIKKLSRNNSKVINIIDAHRKEIEAINRILPLYDNVYIYGANFPAQMLIALGLTADNIKGVLDNSKVKIGNYLYGTKYKVFHPTEITGKHKCLVICKMGAYNTEIKNNLININSEVTII